MSDESTAVDPLDQAAALIESIDAQSDEDQEQEEAIVEASDEDEEDKPKAETPSDVKVKLTLPDGEKEVSLDELKAGYMQQADYTRKTQELAQRERETTQVLHQRLTQSQEVVQSAIQEAEQLISYALNLYTPEQLTTLAQTNPAKWAEEKQRMDVIMQAREQLRQRVNQSRQVTTQQQSDMVEQAKAKAWEVLQAEKIDRPQLEKIYSKASNFYGLSSDELNGILDARAVMIMRDAVAFRESKKSASDLIQKTQKQVAAAPTVKPKAMEPEQSSRNREAEKRIRSGKGSLHDLARFL